MSDLISRQAAIDKINAYGSIWMSYTDGMTKEQIAEEALKTAKEAMVMILQELPAQEEQEWNNARNVPKGNELICHNPCLSAVVQNQYRLPN